MYTLQNTRHINICCCQTLHYVASCKNNEGKEDMLPYVYNVCQHEYCRFKYETGLYTKRQSSGAQYGSISFLLKPSSGYIHVFETRLAKIYRRQTSLCVCDDVTREPETVPSQRLGTERRRLCACAPDSQNGAGYGLAKRKCPLPPEVYCLRCDSLRHRRSDERNEPVKQ